MHTIPMSPVAAHTCTQLQQIQAATVNTNGQVETADNGAPANTSNSLRTGPRGYNLLEDTIVRKKMLHFDRERAPERVVHALGHGAYGTFQSYGDWSNITSACWLQSGAESEVFVRFSVVVAGSGGSEVGRDTHGFATKIYSRCGNQDLVGNHVPSFFINDGADFPDRKSRRLSLYSARRGKQCSLETSHTTLSSVKAATDGLLQLSIRSNLSPTRDSRQEVPPTPLHTISSLNTLKVPSNS